MRLRRLTVKRIARALGRPGRYADGDGLLLQVGPHRRASWLFRYQRAGRTRWCGLGSFPDVSLEEARDDAMAKRKAFRERGIDPIDVKRAAKAAARAAALAAQATARTFGQTAEALFESERQGWGVKHAMDWQTTLLAQLAQIQPSTTGKSML
jgi:Arm DNA-binding domain